MSGDKNLHGGDPYARKYPGTPALRAAWEAGVPHPFSPSRIMANTELPLQCHLHRSSGEQGAATASSRAAGAPGQKTESQCTWAAVTSTKTAHTAPSPQPALTSLFGLSEKDLARGPTWGGVCWGDGHPVAN